MNRLKTWIINFSNLPSRLMASYLRKRGWVVFYLEEQARTCNNGTCWLRLYEQALGSADRKADNG